MKKQDGAAMIVVMCVMVVTVALSLALLLSASVMLNNANRANRKEQCRITAISVSDALKERILSYEYRGEDGFPSNEPSGIRETGEAKEKLEMKLQTIVTNAWYSYDPSAIGVEKLQKQGKDTFTYVQKENPDSKLPGTTTLKLYWMDETDENLKTLDRNKIEEAAEKFQSVVLYVEVTNTVGEESSTIISLFHPLPGKIDEKKKVWESWSWVYDGRGWEGGDS